MNTPSNEIPAAAKVIPIQLRFGDMDALGHINNVSVMRIIEESRCRFLVGSDSSVDQQVVVARQNVEYRASLAYSVEPVQTYLWASRVGTSSFDLACAIVDPSGVIAAIAVTTGVVVDANLRPTALSPGARAELEGAAGPAPTFR